MDARDEKIAKLQAYFADQEDIVMAFLFGSQAKGYARSTSDWDVGVYLAKEDRTREQEIWSAVEHIVTAEVDLVVLNRAPATVVWTAVRAGHPLTIKDRRRYHDVMFAASDEANAWYETSRRYYEIFERSRSLSPEDKDRLRRIITFLEEAIREYPDFLRMTQAVYMSDRSAKRNVEHWAEHLIVSAVDIAEIVLASSRHPLPTIYRELMRELGTIKPFSDDNTCERLAAWVQLRNALAHEYLDYRWKELEQFMHTTQPLLERLIVATKQYLAKSDDAQPTKIAV